MTVMKLGFTCYAEISERHSGRVELTLCTASTWAENGAGYAPAESINVTMSKVEAHALAAAILEAVAAKAEA
jgi:hypothetical protein